MIRVMLCDDHDVVRAGLRSLLTSVKDVEVVCEAADGQAAVTAAMQNNPDIVVMDIAMPSMNGLEATRQLKAAGPEIRVITLSMHGDRQFVLETFKAGASAYLLKNSAAQDLLPAIRAVAAGRTFLSPQIADVVLADYVRHVPSEPASAASLLSVRERQVLQLLAEGKTSKEIAQVLHVTPKTVESHRAQIMDKLGVRTVAELTKIAIREGLTSL